MKAYEKFIHTLGRFAVGIGVALGVACAVVIVSSPPAIERTQAIQPGAMVRLDPVIVTISAQRFDAIRAESRDSTMLAHVFGGGPKQVS